MRSRTRRVTLTARPAPPSQPGRWAGLSPALLTSLPRLLLVQMAYGADVGFTAPVAGEALSEG
jgi:hypothetical protein